MQAIKDGILHKDWFGYAATEKPPGTYEGLLFGATGGVYLNDSSVLVRADAAAAAAAPRSVPPLELTIEDAGGESSAGGKTTVQVSVPVKGSRKPASSPPAQVTYRRFHATAAVDAQDPIGSFTEIVQGVVEHFSAQYGNQLTITVDIEARRPAGFDAKLVRVAKENAATLKFKTAEFEED